MRFICSGVLVPRAFQHAFSHLPLPPLPFLNQCTRSYNSHTVPQVIVFIGSGKGLKPLVVGPTSFYTLTYRNEAQSFLRLGHGHQDSRTRSNLNLLSLKQRRNELFGSACAVRQPLRSLPLCHGLPMYYHSYSPVLHTACCTASCAP